MQAREHLITIAAVAGIITFIMLLKQRGSGGNQTIVQSASPSNPATIALNYAIDESRAVATQFSSAKAGTNASGGSVFANIPIIGGLFSGSGGNAGSSQSGVAGTQTLTAIDKFTNSTVAQNLTQNELTQLETFFKDIGGNYQSHVINQQSTTNGYQETVGLSGPVSGQVTVTGNVKVAK